MTNNPDCPQKQDALVNGTTKTDDAGPVTRGWMSRTLPDICFELQGNIDAFLAEQTDDHVLRNVQSQIKVSMDVITEALRRYGPDHLSLSYNGGKDCLVLLVLILACLPSCASPSSPSSSHTTTTTNFTAAPASENALPSPATLPGQPLQAIYIVSSDPFSEVEDFVAESADRYHLDLKRYALPMRPALEAYLEDRPAVKAIFLGTRRTDPHGEFLTHFDPTDEGWPQFMRVHPVIDWHYVEIWAFIRRLQIPFCDLYNRGFTSLGGVTNTRPNPALAVGGDASKFRPAYELRDDDEERLGRD
jgi:FAD synthetase